MPSRPTSTATTTTTGCISVPYEFLQSLVEWQNMTTTLLTDGQFELTLLYVQIQPWVQMMLETVKTQIWVVL